MSNTKHTPGPWHISSASKNAINAERNNKPIGIGTTYYDPDSVYFIGQDEAIANAILIAAAPELLQALIKERDRAVTNWCMEAAKHGFAGGYIDYLDRFGKPEYIAEMDAAIAKATKP